MPKAILSVHDKTGLVGFAHELESYGWELIASGGTARLLRENGLEVSEVAEYTRSPELLGGRVKTLHPAIHSGLLARQSASDQAELLAQGWDYINLAVVNLYPFQETIRRPGVTLEEAVENIDIGGVALARAAAKNHARVTVICDPADYSAVIAELRVGGVSPETRRRLALKAFALTAQYDAAIAAYLGGEEVLHLDAYPVQRLRYGENPHQTAAYYSFTPGGGPLGGALLQGKELSYTNLLDLDAAWRAALSFERPAVCIVKHVSPCGIAHADEPAEALRLALECDPVSAFGGVIACNRPVDLATVEAMGDLFIECIIAPDYSTEARQLLASRKNCRLLEMKKMSVAPAYELRTINGGVLKQDLDQGDPAGVAWKVVSKRAPTEAEWSALRFAMTACRHVKSNAIVLAQGGAAVGIGGGQPNRVDCVRTAVQRAGARAPSSVMASDGFFPFPDSIEVAAASGITAVVHPGGSLRDGDATASADVHNIAMVVTGIRHFKH